MTKNVSSVLANVRLINIEELGVGSNLVLVNGKKDFNMPEDCIVLLASENSNKTKLFVVDEYSKEEVLSEGFEDKIRAMFKSMKGALTQIKHRLFYDGVSVIPSCMQITNEIKVENPEKDTTYFGYMDMDDDEVGIVQMVKGNLGFDYYSNAIVKDMSLIMGEINGVYPNNFYASIDAAERFFKAAVPYYTELVTNIELQLDDMDDIIDDIVKKIISESDERIIIFEKEDDFEDKLMSTVVEYLRLIDYELYSEVDVRFTNNDHVIMQLDDDDFWEEDYHYETFVITTPTTIKIKTLANEDKLSYKDMYDYVLELVEAYKANEINE